MSIARLLITMLGLCSKNDKMLGDFKETVVYFTENQVNIIMLKYSWNTKIIGTYFVSLIFEI